MKQVKIDLERRSTIAAICLAALLATNSQSGSAQVLSSGLDRSAAINAGGHVSWWQASSGGAGFSNHFQLNPIGLASGDNHVVVLQSGGTVVGIGSNSHGQTNPQPALTNAKAVAAGALHSVALRADGRLHAWGDNSHGKVSGAFGVTNAVIVDAGTHHSLALRSDGTVAAWGFDSHGQIAGASAITNATDIAAGANHSVALRSDGTVAAWGSDFFSQTSGAAGVTNAVAVDAGAHHSLALRSDGTVAAWGYDHQSQVSDASTLSDVVFVSAGIHHNLAVRSNGDIVAWGQHARSHRGPVSDVMLPTNAHWTTATDGDYLNSHRWSQQIPTTALSDAVFDQEGTYTVGFGNDARARNLDVTAGNVTFAQNGNAYTVENGIVVNEGATFTTDGPVNAKALAVATTSVASMIQTGGAGNIGTEIVVGQQVGSNGTYTISGGTLDTGTDSGAVDPDLEVGYSGTGTFDQSGGVVTVADELVIGHEASGIGTVNLSGGTLNVMDDSHRGVYVGFRGTGELVVSGTGQLTTQSVLSVGTESGAMGTVTQTGGSVSVHEVRLADAAGAQATYSMQGGTLNTTSHLYVGEADVATYTQAGGDVTVGVQFRVNHGSTATINDGTLHSVDSLRVGTSVGQSTMIQNGGLVKTGGYFAIGSGGNGTYNMTGGTLEAKAVSRGLYVGTEAGATGSMNQSGGLVDVGDLVVGNGSAQSGEYTFSNGTIAVRDRLVVGNHVLGTFNQSGGTINAAAAPVTVGNVATADGSAYSMSGGTLNADSLIVGNYGDATFTQTLGAVNASSVVVAQQAGSTANYSLTGGTLTTDSLSFGAGTGSFDLDGGTLNVGTLNDAGGTFTVSSGTLNADNVMLASLNMSDGLLDLGTLNGDLNMSGGILAPGNSPGITTINGDYDFSGGVLEMELAGLTQETQYDFLDVNGDWTITGGDLQISLLGGFTPVAGNSFDLFDFNSVSGTFDNVLLPTLDSNYAWDTSSLYSTGVLSVTATAVPEPGAVVLLGAGAFVALIRRRRQKQKRDCRGSLRDPT